MHVVEWPVDDLGAHWCEQFLMYVLLCGRRLFLVDILHDGLRERQIPLGLRVHRGFHVLLRYLPKELLLFLRLLESLLQGQGHPDLDLCLVKLVLSLLIPLK